MKDNFRTWVYNESAKESDLDSEKEDDHCQGLKEIDSIWVILKESKSWGEKKVERKLDILRKRYMCRYHKYVNKAFKFP